MKQEDLPQRWQSRLQNHLLEIGSKYKKLSADAFQKDLKITFTDNSHVFFYYAFYWVDEVSKEFAVFTEHCGYHIFPLINSIIETVDKDGNIIKIEDFTIE